MIVSIRIQSSDDYKYRYLVDNGINVSRFLGKCLNNLYNKVLIAEREQLDMFNQNDEVL